MTLSLDKKIRFIPKNLNKNDKIIITLVQPTFLLAEHYFGFDLEEVKKGKKISKELVAMVEKYFIDKVIYNGEIISKEEYREKLSVVCYNEILKEIGRAYTGETVAPVIKEYKEFLEAADEKTNYEISTKETSLNFRFCYEIFEKYYNGNGLPLSATWAEHPYWVNIMIKAFHKEYTLFQNRIKKEK